jgi:hypothetical protein
MEALDVIQQMKGAISGLIPGGTPGVVSLQQGDYPDAEGCCTPAHCMRTVSQRSLNTSTRFSSDLVAYAPGTPGGLLTSLISDPALGALPGIDLEPDSFVFNNANVQDERSRINNLVLIGIRATIQVQVLDASPVAAGAIDLCSYGSYLEDLISRHLFLSIYHMADRKDPWVDQTSIGYFMRHGKFFPVPPLKWIDRDPAMALSLKEIEFGNDPGAATGIPFVDSPPRSLNAKLNIDVDALYIPDPDACGPYWPGTLCPKEAVGNTPYYTGNIKTARIKNGMRG